MKHIKLKRKGKSKRRQENNRERQMNTEHMSGMNFVDLAIQLVESMEDSTLSVDKSMLLEARLMLLAANLGPHTTL